MSDFKDLVRDIINLTSPSLKDEPEIVEGIVEAIDTGLQRMIVEDGKVTFQITQKGIEYVEAMPFHSIGEPPT